MIISRFLDKFKMIIAIEKFENTNLLIDMND